MVVLYIIIFILLVVFSAFFSSAETSLLSLDKIKLNLKAQKKKKKAVLLKQILKEPEEFFSTILIGNNFVNIAAASISTVLFTRLITAQEEWSLLISTVATTIIILLFAEIIPKSFAFHYSEKLSYFYAYPIRFFNYFFYPFVKATSFISNLLFKKGAVPVEKKDFTIEEIKHFLSSEIKLFRHHPEALRMVNEILDTAEKDVKSIMTPRMNIVALEETASMDELMKIIVEKNLSKIPIFRKNLDHITGIVHAGKLIPALVTRELKKLSLQALAVKPIFISEYSSLIYVLKEFKKQVLNMAVVLDEYGSTIGILTLNDIFREILGEIEIGYRPIRQISENQFLVKGSLPVEEVNAKLNIQLPERKDYTTISGMFIYHFGKFPHEGSSITAADIQLTVKRMGKRKIDEILLMNP
ncbi:MAG: HlyC/CorC family transporter [Candidatus Aminicenantes bacterium]|nr:MAG: HlyC/CorC family transporter [Candidatus Aminicenantes bacterium]